MHCNYSFYWSNLVLTVCYLHFTENPFFKELRILFNLQVELSPLALDSFEEIVQQAKIPLFLDYDGTLTPVVREPEMRTCLIR